MRFIALFDQQDEAQRAAMRQLNRELVEAGVELGFVPYKTPPWAVALIADRLDPGFRRVLGTVRRALDPQRIMAPHCWHLED
jgi:hypothetical protein